MERRLYVRRQSLYSGSLLKLLRSHPPTFVPMTSPCTVKVMQSNSQHSLRPRRAWFTPTETEGVRNRLNAVPDLQGKTSQRVIQRKPLH